MSVYSETDILIDEYIRPRKPSIPCQDNKCLKYPACRSKKSIYCRPLLKRFRDIEEEGSWSAWEIMRIYFPNLMYINNDK